MNIFDSIHDRIFPVFDFIFFWSIRHGELTSYFLFYFRFWEALPSSTFFSGLVSESMKTHEETIFSSISYLQSERKSERGFWKSSNWNPSNFISWEFFSKFSGYPSRKISENSKFWVGRIWLAEELFDSKYPFLFPDFLKTKRIKYQFEVRVEFRKVFHSVEITKTFVIQQFLDSDSTVSNQRINKIQKNFIKFVQILQESDWIESNDNIISNGSFLDTNELNISNISEGFVIDEKISIWLNCCFRFV